MAPPSHLDVNPAAQRAIFIGDVCPPTSLMLARRYVDLLAHPPPPPKDLSQRTHPLRRVLECTTEEMTKTTTSSSSSSCTPPTSAELRRALVQRHGSPDGSRMFREWVERPRTTLQNVVRHLCDGIQRYYANNTDARDVLDDLDLHVRLYPTSCPSSCMPATMAACGAMCAAVIVRRRSSLRQLREELMQLSARYVGVAAEGQTLEDSLAFWRITSYEHERLLMEEEDLLHAQDAQGANDADGPSPSSSSSSWNAWESSLSAEDRGMLADIFRRPPLGWSSVSAAAEELRGAAPQRADGEKDGEGGRRTRIILGPTEEVGTMAAHLPSFSQPTLLVEKKGGRGGGRPDPSTRKRRRDAPTSSPSSISQSMCGLVGVWYVSVDGMAYLGYPAPPPSLATTTTTSSSSFPPPSLMPALSVTDEMNEAEMKTTLPKVPLPLNSELSFTRGLLRL